MQFMATIGLIIGFSALIGVLVGVYMRKIDINIEVHQPSYSAGWEDCTESFQEERDNLLCALSGLLVARKIKITGGATAEYKKLQRKAWREAESVFSAAMEIK